MSHSLDQANQSLKCGPTTLERFEDPPTAPGLEVFNSLRSEAFKQVPFFFLAAHLKQKVTVHFFSVIQIQEPVYSTGTAEGDQFTAAASGWLRR